MNLYFKKPFYHVTDNTLANYKKILNAQWIYTSIDSSYIYFELDNITITVYNSSITIKKISEGEDDYYNIIEINTINYYWFFDEENFYYFYINFYKECINKNTDIETVKRFLLSLKFKNFKDIIIDRINKSILNIYNVGMEGMKIKNLGQIDKNNLNDILKSEDLLLYFPNYNIIFQSCKNNSLIEFFNLYLFDEDQTEENLYKRLFNTSNMDEGKKCMYKLLLSKGIRKAHIDNIYNLKMEIIRIEENREKPTLKLNLSKIYYGYNFNENIKKRKVWCWNCEYKPMTNELLEEWVNKITFYTPGVIQFLKFLFENKKYNIGNIKLSSLDKIESEITLYDQKYGLNENIFYLNYFSDLVFMFFNGKTLHISPKNSLDNKSLLISIMDNMKSKDFKNIKNRYDELISGDNKIISLELKKKYNEMLKICNTDFIYNILMLVTMEKKILYC